VDTSPPPRARRTRLVLAGKAAAAARVIAALATRASHEPAAAAGTSERGDRHALTASRQGTPPELGPFLDRARTPSAGAPEATPAALRPGSVGAMTRFARAGWESNGQAGVLGGSLLTRDWLCWL
jgi:hypothetical protein